MNSKVILVDQVVENVNDKNVKESGGHNRTYMETIGSIEDTLCYDCPEKFPHMVKKPYKGYITRKNYFNNIPKGEGICYLNYDSIYLVPQLVKKLTRRFKFSVAVLHWFPRKKMQHLFLKESSKCFNCIVVHSEFIKKELNSIGINNVQVIDYPCFCKINVNDLSYEKKVYRKKFLCLGASRIDKGYDVLADSFSYLDENTKNMCEFVIAGKEQDISYDMIKNKAKENGVNINIVDDVISDEDYWKYILEADIVLLPYKKIFSGNSGPMTDGIYANRYILGPDKGNIGYLINKYNLGSTFEIENSKSLAAEISKISVSDTTCNHSYKEKLEVSSFIQSYKELFEKLKRSDK